MTEPDEEAIITGSAASIRAGATVIGRWRIRMRIEVQSDGTGTG